MAFYDDYAQEIEAVSTEQIPTGKNDNSIIPQHPLFRLSESINEVDLVNTLQVKIKDSLTKYQNKEGDIDPFKIPQNLYVVAIVHEIMDAAKKINLGVFVKHGAIYIYNGKYWQEVGDEDIKRVLSNLAIKLGFYSPATAQTSDFKKKLFTQFMDTGLDGVKFDESNKKILINLRNGTLEIDKNNVKLRDHNRDDFLTYVLNYDYDENATTPIFSKFISEVLPDQTAQKVLQEFMGYVFTTNLKLEKVAVLYGSGANGKSVFFEIMSELMGKDNLSFKGLGEICMRGERGDNHRSQLEGKLINYASELNPQGADIEIFKALVSGEPISARRLFKNVFTMSNSAKLIFNANKLPTETERTHGFFRRFLIIPFSVTITEDKKDIHLHNKIIDAELSGVLNWAINGLKRLLEKENFTHSDAIEKAVSDYQKETNSVALFAEEENFVADDNGAYYNQMLYEEYKEWCKDSGMKSFNSVNFSKEFGKLGFERARTSKGRYFKVLKSYSN